MHLFPGPKEYLFPELPEGVEQILELDDRIYAFSKRDAFLTVKDHKPNFMNNIKCRLINPAKSDLGKVSKSILSRIVTSLREKTKLNQWKNSFSVIDWFKKLNDKETLSFLMFDIVEFYPNITEDLLKKALEYAKNHVNISHEEVKIILQTKKAFLFADKKPWIKKGNNVFDERWAPGTVPRWQTLLDFSSSPN
jgi:hypothetical protein